MKEICGAGGMLGDVGWMVTGAGATRPAEGPAALSASDGGSFESLSGFGRFPARMGLACFTCSVHCKR